MGLVKQTVFDHGKYGDIPIDYWRITNAHFELVQDIVEVILSGYMNKAARNNGKQSLERQAVTVRGAKALLTASSDVLAALYPAIKAEYPDQWGDALDE